MEKRYQQYTLGSSIVTLRIGDITESRAKVLVSSDDTDISMTDGVSKAILMAGGNAIREEAKRKAGQHNVGDVVVTTAGNLAHADHVFHAISRKVASFKTSADEARRIAGTVIRKCIRLLCAMDLTSIAFPAVGTGFAQFDPADVALEMAKVLREELKTIPQSLSIEIYLYPNSITADVGFFEFFRRFDEQAGLVDVVVRDHAVVLIHGIRTEARWFERVSRLLKELDHQLHPVKDGYEYFDLFRFVIPSDRLKQSVLERVEENILALQDQKAIRKISVVAHSFGTYLIAKIIERNKSLRIHRLLLCGSVLPSDYKWQNVLERLDVIDERENPTQRVINDCGWNDIWPLLAESGTWGYGASGRFGFQTPWVVDRFHGKGHSDFFDNEFITQFWYPALVKGQITDTTEERPATAWALQILRVVRLRYLFFVLLPMMVFGYILFRLIIR